MHWKFAPLFKKRVENDGRSKVPHIKRPHQQETHKINTFANFIKNSFLHCFICFRITPCPLCVCLKPMTYSILPFCIFPMYYLGERWSDQSCWNGQMVQCCGKKLKQKPTIQDRVNSGREIWTVPIISTIITSSTIRTKTRKFWKKPHDLLRLG